MKQVWMGRLAVASVAAGLCIVACSDDTSSSSGSSEAGQPGSGGNSNEEAGGASKPQNKGGAADDNGGTGNALGGAPSSGSGGTAGSAGAATAEAGDTGAGGISASGASAGGAFGGGGYGGDGGDKVCSVKQYGDLGDELGVAQDQTVDNQVITWGLDLQADTPHDQLSLELYAGSGVFKDGIKTGTYQLKGAELNYSTCGVCIRFFEQTDDKGMAQAVYFPTGGTVALTSVNGKLTGLLSNVTLQEVTIAPGTYVSTPVPNACTTVIKSVSFDSPITVN